MITLNPPIRYATQQDAVAMAELVNMAGEGMPYYLWSQMAEADESPWNIGQKRAQRESGGFSYRNTIVREEDNEIFACLIGYPLADNPDPDVYIDMPDMFVPLQELEDLACGSWYVNVLATFPDYRGKGYGSEFLALAEKLSRDCNKKGMSVIVSDANPGAQRLYERNNYNVKATRPMFKEDWQNPGENWILLVKDFNNVC